MDNDSIDVSSKENGMKRRENYQNHVYVLQDSPQSTHHVIDCCVHCHHFNIIIIMDFTFIIWYHCCHLILDVIVYVQCVHHGGQHYK